MNSYLQQHVADVSNIGITSTKTPEMKYFFSLTRI